MCAFGQALGEAEGAVARERTHFEHVLRLHHLDEHLQQSSLEVSRRHASVYGVDVCGTIEAIEIVALGRGVFAYVFVEFFCHFFVVVCYDGVSELKYCMKS